jgi:uncharacterized protein (TIGR02246 family)
MVRILPLLLCALVLCSCAPKKQDVAEVRKTIEAMTEKSEKEIMAGVTDTTLSQYTDDAVSMPNNGPLLRGKKAMREYYGRVLSTGVKFTAVNFTTTDVFVNGTMACELGTYTMTMQIPGVGETTDTGKYMTLYEQSSDGSWKIRADTWNTNVQPPMPTTAP